MYAMLICIKAINIQPIGKTRPIRMIPLEPHG